MVVIAENEHDQFKRSVALLAPSARGFVWIAGWMDPRPVYTITFKNGAVFEGQVKHRVIEEAKAYANGLYRLTGEFP